MSSRDRDSCQENLTANVDLFEIWQGQKGDKGDPGDPVSISADQNNAIKYGSDGRMLVDDVLSTNCATDFLSIYQLSK